MTKRDTRQTALDFGDQSGLVGAVLVVALLFLGFALLAGLRYFGPAASLDQQSLTQRNFDAVQSSLHLFLTRNYRLPCPADGRVAQGATGDGVENCTVVGQNYGVIPWQTLGMSRAQSLDGYNNRLGYAVPAALSSGTPYKTAATPPTNSTPIQLCSASSACASPTAYAYVIISYGLDGAGAYLPSGQRQALPATTLYEYPNTESTAFSGASPYFVTYPYCNNPTCLAGSTSTALFDDAIVGESNLQLFTEFVQATSGPAAASQAAQRVAATPTLGAGDTAGLSNAGAPVSGGWGGTGQLTAASLANPLAFVGDSSCQGNYCVNTGTTVNGVTTASLAPSNGYYKVTVSGVNTGGISSGNQPLNTMGDAIGANNTNSCTQCASGSGVNPSYLLPGQTLTYTFYNVSFTSFAFVDFLVNGGMTVQVTGYVSLTPDNQASWIQVGQLNISNGPYTDNSDTVQNFNPACLGPAQADVWPEPPTGKFPTLVFPLSPSWLQFLQPTFTSYIPQNNADPNENISPPPTGAAPWSTGYPPAQLSQQWPPVSLLTGLANYQGAFDNQFANRKFVDSFGNVLPFNVLQFELQPYTDSSGITDSCSPPTGCTPAHPSGQYAEAMYFEGLKACPTYPAETITVGGAPSPGDTISLTFVNAAGVLPALDETVTLTYSSEAVATTTATVTFNLAFGGANVVDSVTFPSSTPIATVVAGELAKLINADSNLSAATIRANNFTSTGGFGASVMIVDEAGEIPTTDTVLSATVSGGSTIGALSTNVAIDGTPSAGEILSLTFTNAGLSETVQYQVSASDTAATIAFGLAEAINGDTVLTAASISASSIITPAGFTIVDSGSLPVAVAANNSAVLLSYTVSTSSGANVCDMQGSVSYPPPNYTANTSNAAGDTWWNPPVRKTMDCSLQNGLSLQ